VNKTVNPRSLKNLRPWRKGESGNPSGRPRRALTEAYQQQLSMLIPGDPQERTYAERIAEAQIRKAVRGSTFVAKEIADRSEGRVGQAIEVDLAAPDFFYVQVNFVDSDGGFKREP
jgi:hypothetical protein